MTPADTAARPGRLNHLAASQPALVGRYRQAAARLNAGERDRPFLVYDVLAPSGG